MSDTRFWLLALLGITVLRLVVAAWLPLAPDEAYYWVWGRALAASYYDHPPMVAWWIAAGTLVVGDTALGVRLLAPLGVAVASMALARAGNLFFPAQRPGFWAAALLNATLLFAAGSVLMTPDTPLLVFWCCAIWALAMLQATQDGRWWLAFGILAGCALLAKYTAVFLGLGVLVWLLAHSGQRRWFRDWRLWIGGPLALLVFSPVIVWNASHHWVSFAKQGGRAGSGNSGFSLRYLGELIGGQIGLVTPIIFLLCVAGLVAACRRWTAASASAERLLVSITLPAAVVFVWQATGSRVQGNWPAILYPSACLAATALLHAGWRKWFPGAAALGLLLTTVVMVQATTAPIPLPRRSDPSLARMGGWSDFASEIDKLRKERKLSFVAAEEYGLAGELAMYLPREVPVFALGDRWDLFDLPDAQIPGAGLLVRSARRGEGPPLWPQAQPSGELLRSRQGIEAERYRLYEVSPQPDAPPIARMPQRRER